MWRNFPSLLFTMRSILHSKNTYLLPTSPLGQFISPTPEKFLNCNKENFPTSHLCSESTTEDYYSKEDSEYDDFDDLTFVKHSKPKLDKRSSDELNKKTPSIDDAKYKTEMCKNWEERGRCNYGKKCRFAHGKHELVDKSLINKDRYKSKLCNSFHASFFCPYGQRCLFIHSQPKKIEDIMTKSQYRRQLNALTLDSFMKNKEGNKRCELFVKIRNENQKELDRVHEEFCRKLVDEE